VGLQETVAKRLKAELALVSLAALLTLPSAAAAQTSLPASVVVDRDMTPAAGVADVLAVQHLLASVEDQLLPVRLSETTPAKSALGIAYRIGKWAALDLPQDSFLMVAAHEVFGHGARLRELNATGIGYDFHAPPPYGDGSAATSFDDDVLRTASRADRLSIDAAGIEAQNLLADDIAAESLARGSLSYRSAWLYAQSRIAGLLYIRSVSPQSEPGHDVAAFLSDFNDGCLPPACTPLESQSLKRRALLMLADPMLAFSAYGFAAAYLVQGRPSSPVAMIPLPHGYGYLPTVDFAMTPYGTEWTTDHYIRTGRRLTKVSVRMGDTGTARAWGIGVRATRIAVCDRVAVDLAADIWRQPPIDTSTPTAALTTGGLAAATVRFAIGSAQTAQRIGLLAQVGYKSGGFVPGERLSAGPVVRVGVAIALDGVR
jgi:hypothetical protein